MNGKKSETVAINGGECFVVLLGVKVGGEKTKQYFVTNIEISVFYDLS